MKSLPHLMLIAVCGRSLRYNVHHHSSKLLSRRFLMSQDSETSTSTSGSDLLAAVQMTSTNDKVSNLRSTILLVECAASKGARFISLPECSSFIGGGTLDLNGEIQRPLDAIMASEALDGPYGLALCELAARLQIWLSVGGFPELVEDVGASAAPRKVYNTNFMISPFGVIVDRYRKIHLFDSPMAGLMESNSTKAGESLVVSDCGFARIGLTICYDLRFPELYGALCRPLRTSNDMDTTQSQKILSGLGAEIVLVPAAFTVPTGTAHWDILLRARAIENQCYVIAAAQIGAHNDKRSSYGRTCIIDPWGNIVASCPSISDMDSDVNKLNCHVVEGVGSICFAPFDRDLLTLTRAKMPVQSHRQPDIYYKSDIPTKLRSAI